MSVFIGYARFYTRLLDQGFQLLKKPAGCIKMGLFMQIEEIIP
ncbi:MAG: hypothetical protein ACQEWW_23115 [Bacillota bacterium]